MNLADVQFSSRAVGVVASISGEIDLSNADDLGKALEAAPGNSPGLIVDLSGVEYLDSAGIHLIYRLRESLNARKKTLVLVVPTRSPSHDALRLAGVAQHVETVETLDDALSSLA